VRIYPFFLPHAGCPHRCLFCSQWHSEAGEGRLPSPVGVADALDSMLPSRGDGEVAFYGGTFTLLPVEQQLAWLEAVTPFIRKGRVAGIRVSTRPDAMAAGVAEWLAGIGVTTIELGCQSFSAEVLRRSERGHDEQAAGNAVQQLRLAGLAVGLQLMPGLPGSNRAEAIASLTTALSLSPDFLRIYPAVVLRGTGLARLYLAGSYVPLSLEDAVDCCAEMLWHCRRAGVPVIRVGVQATPELDRGEALLAGPYHPAFGQLVRSRLWQRALRRGIALTGTRRVFVHPADLSDAIGHRRSNLEALHENFGEISLRADVALKPGEMALGGESFSLLNLSGFEGT